MNFKLKNQIKSNWLNPEFKLTLYLSWKRWGWKIIRQWKLQSPCFGSCFVTKISGLLKKNQKNCSTKTFMIKVQNLLSNIKSTFLTQTSHMPYHSDHKMQMLIPLFHNVIMVTHSPERCLFLHCLLSLFLHQPWEDFPQDSWSPNLQLHKVSDTLWFAILVKLLGSNNSNPETLLIIWEI